MKGVLVMTLVGNWTIASPDGEFKITPEKACAGEECTATGPVKIDERGMWLLESLDVDLRGNSPTTVQIRKPRQPWITAELTFAEPVEVKIPKEGEEASRWDLGVLPGRWIEAKLKCKDDEPVPVYEPIMEEQKANAVIKGSVKQVKLPEC